MTRDEFEKAWPARTLRTVQGRSFRLPCPGVAGSAELFLSGVPAKGVTVELLAGTGRKLLRRFYFLPGTVPDEQTAAERALRMAADYMDEQIRLFQAISGDLRNAIGGIPSGPMDRNAIMAAAKDMAAAGDGIMGVFHQNMTQMAASDPAKYDQLMSRMESLSFADRNELKDYVER